MNVSVDKRKTEAERLLLELNNVIASYNVVNLGNADLASTAKALEKLPYGFLVEVRCDIKELFQTTDTVVIGGKKIDFERGIAALNFNPEAYKSQNPDSSTIPYSGKKRRVAYLRERGSALRFAYDPELPSELGIQTRMFENEIRETATS